MLSSILVFLIVLSVLILVHELGHFWVARKNGVWVEEFGFGLPPRVWGKKVRGTLYSINLLPFGGFVRLHGENTDEEVTNPNRAFVNKSKKARSAIVVAGVVMNFILAVVAFAIVYSFSGIPRETDEVKILEVVAGSPAQTAGILVGDVVKTVEKESISSIEQFVAAIDEKKGGRAIIEVRRELEGDFSTQKITIRPREAPPEGEGPIGVIISSTEIYFPPVWQRPFVGIYFGFKEAFFWGSTVVVGVVKIFADLFAGTAPKDLAGPVGIFAITNQAAAIGTLAVINFIGILSINLAILNIIPFPALDGGRLLFIAIEKAVGRRVLPKIESTIHTIGMIILLILIFAITASDIKRLINSGSLSGFVDSFLKQ